MALNRMETDSHVAVIKRRAGSIYFSLPKPEDNIVCTAHINEEDVITDASGVRYTPVVNPIVEAIDPDNTMEIPLLDTTKIEAVEPVSLEDALASVDSQEVKLDAQIGTFTYRDLTNMLYSLYAFYDAHRVTNVQMGDIEEEPEVAAMEAPCQE